MRYLIKNIIKHNANVSEFQLYPESGELPKWTPGAHIELIFYSRARQPFRNAYSIVGESNNKLRIVVQREEFGHGGSKFLHDEAEVDMEVEVNGPFASFEFQIGAKRNVLIAGGIGITPLVSMARDLNLNNSSFELHYLTRQASLLVLMEEFEMLDNGKIYTYSTEFSRPDLQQIIGNFVAGSELHACGPVSLMEAIRSTAITLGWPSENIHFESFGSRTLASDRPITVHLRQSEMTLNVLPGTSILDAMIAAGAFVSFECKRGECGNCYASVVSGQPLHRDICLTPEQRAIGMTTCVSWAEGAELVLDL